MFAVKMLLGTLQLVERYLERCGRGRIETALRQALLPSSHPDLLVKHKHFWGE